MRRSNEDWHARFKQQAGWTSQLRRYLLGRLNLDNESRILEVGCGTGAITSALNLETPARIYGLDLNLAFLRLARLQDRETAFCCANGLALPFPDGLFDAVVCHFFLLWISEPAAALAEMVRVARPGGAVLALAEPDYGGRIDFPPPLDTLGNWQAEALRRQGAAPNRGRELAGLFHASGLQAVEIGILGGQWQGQPGPAEIETEWATLADDLAGAIPDERLAELRQIDLEAWQAGERVLFVPTFYAVGNKV